MRGPHFGLPVALLGLLGSSSLGCKPGAQATSSLMVAESYSEHSAIKKYCSGGGKKTMMRQMTVRIDANTTMLVHSRDICAKRSSKKAFALGGDRVPIVILRYGAPENLVEFRKVEGTLQKSGYDPIVISNKSGEALRSEFEKLKASRPELANQDLRAIVQGHGAISSDDQQHVISIKHPPTAEGAEPTFELIKTAEDVVAPFEVLTGRTQNCSILIDSCYSGQVVHDVNKPTRPNDYLGPDGKVAVASAVNSNRPDVADNGTVLNYMLSMSDVDSPDRAAADADKDGSVSLAEASSYLGTRRGIHHESSDFESATYERFNLAAQSWIAPHGDGRLPPGVEDRLKTNDSSSRETIESIPESKASGQKETVGMSNVNSGMFVGGSREAAEMTLFPLPVEDDTPAPVYGDSRYLPTNDLQSQNPDQRE